MTWRGNFAFGSTAVAFRGDSAENRFHAHAAVQCVYSASGTELQDAQKRSHEGTGWLVRSGVGHRLAPARQLVLLLIEPQSPLAEALLRRVPAAPIAPIPDDVERILRDTIEVEALLPALESHLVRGTRAVDPRVLKALDSIGEEGARNTAAAAARHADVSPSRLRQLCRDHFGVPFAKLLLWRKVRRACIAMEQGRPLAEAALEAGFADQAHLTRTMIDVIGLTPGEAARASG